MLPRHLFMIHLFLAIRIRFSFALVLAGGVTGCDYSLWFVRMLLTNVRQNHRFHLRSRATKWTMDQLHDVFLQVFHQMVPVRELGVAVNTLQLGVSTVLKRVVRLKFIEVIGGEVALLYGALVQTVQFVVSMLVAGIYVVHQWLFIPATKSNISLDLWSGSTIVGKRNKFPVLHF